ncbi:MAG TPA: hypothetical protein VGC80_12860, partial [Acetobacteraceae bacterium]
MPEAHRYPRRTAWSDANRAGAAIGSVLEGPCVDAAGSLPVTDIPNGRIFRVGPRDRDLMAEYAGWPNGMAAEIPPACEEKAGEKVFSRWT